MKTSYGTEILRSNMGSLEGPDEPRKSNILTEQAFGKLCYLDSGVDVGCGYESRCRTREVKK